MIQFFDCGTPITGSLSIYVYRNGELVIIDESDNLIVDGARMLHARLIGGDTLNRSVTRVGFGTGTTAPAAGNTSLAAGAHIKAVDGVTYPAANQVRFAISLGTAEFNTRAISEFGLFAADGTLYARRVRATPIHKDTDISLTGTWTITF